MYGTIYQIGIYLASKGLVFGGLINRATRQFVQEREHAPRPEAGKVKYWFHCASVGEFEMALPVIRRMVREGAEEEVLITFFSPTGYQQARKNARWAERVMYLPLDERSAVREFYKDYQPEHGILVRYELWYNLLKEGLRSGCQFHLINARFQKGHLIFGFLGRPYFRLLKQFQQIFTSDQESAERLKEKGIEAVQFTGDTRYDRMLEIKEKAKEFDRIAAFKGDSPLLILGSSYVAEESILLDIMHDLPEVKIVIAPHHIGEERIIEIETLFSSFRPRIWSNPVLGSMDQLLIINNIGMLSALYRYADMALIGGGFSGALHNVIEPLMWGNLVVFGPHHDKFPEAQGLLDEGLAFEVREGKDLLQHIRTLMSDQFREQHKQKVEAYVAERLGASQRIAGSISEIADRQ